MSDRDRKIVLAVVPLLLLVAYWFLVLGPKREEAKTASATLSEQQQRVTDARSKLAAADAAKTDFAKDYTEIVRLGKAIPTTVDMPSLIVQLDGAAAGTGIHFTRIAAGERVPATPAVPTTSSSAEGAAPVEAGGEAAQSAPGSSTEAANNAEQTADQSNQAAEASGVPPSETQTSTTTKTGGLPVGGGSTTTGQAANGAATPTGLDTVSLDLEFVGDFFNLADFFHDVKRFVRVANHDVVVGGRLITIDDVTFSSDTELFPGLKAELKATIYLSPKAEGTTAGATPEAPAPTQAGGGSTPASASSDSAPAPTATAIP